MPKHSIFRNSQSRALLYSLSLGASVGASAQQNDSTREIENFFDKRAQTLQEHLSVPLSDQAFHKRFLDAYEPLDKGRIPVQWRNALVQRLLALSRVNPSNLSAAQQAQIANSLDTLGSASSSSAESAAALSALSGALGISESEAGSALSNAASDTGLFNGNTNVSQSYINNSAAARDAIAGQAANPNSIAMAAIAPPSQVRYENEGGVAAIIAPKMPNPSALSMGPYASQLGKPASPSAPPSSGGPENSKIHSMTAATPHANIMQEALKQGGGAIAGALKKQSPGVPESMTRGNYASSFAHTTPSPIHQQVPVPPSKVTVKSDPAPPKNDPFSFDPTVLLGGGFAEEARQRIEQAFSAAPPTPSPPSATSKGSSSEKSPITSPTASAAGQSLARSNMENALKKHELSCEETLVASLKKDHGLSIDPKQVNGSSAINITPQLSKAIDEHVRSIRTSQGQRAAEAYYQGKRPTTLLKDKKNEELGADELIDLFEDKVIENTAFYNGLFNTSQDVCALNKDRFAFPRGRDHSACDEFKTDSIDQMNLVDTMKLKSLVDLYKDMSDTSAASSKATPTSFVEGGSVALWQVLQSRDDTRKKFLSDTSPFPKITSYKSDTDPRVIDLRLRGQNLAEFLTLSEFERDHSIPRAERSPEKQRVRWILRLRSHLTRCASSPKSWGAKIIELEYHTMRAHEELCSGEAELQSGILPGMEAGLYARNPEDCKAPATPHRTNKKPANHKDSKASLAILGIDFSKKEEACIKLGQYRDTFGMLAQEISRSACSPREDRKRDGHGKGTQNDT